ncbi:gamma-glutamylcyclotransferase [Deinococcus sp. HMF7604]|uniref:gamma-glutamylcyclotransferase family protein n=1 Tax=Deinococcus betulae TaxID=2873312 RepID=UPI001CCF4558|nr:gamma-glutamylcyclotransferase family protein [Deinococcus betulae]MBZ9750498.1 gamma-glutamylcyclotransferase [Deinococcus betulae]
MTPPPTRVFVYGTLMPGERNAHLTAAGVPQAQPATLRGFTLYHLHPEAYPALQAGPAEAQVRGVLLTYGPDAWAAALPQLDELEGVGEQPPLYTREVATLQLDSGEEVAAWVYIYARPDRLAQPGAAPVAGGDWRAAPHRERPAAGER